MKKLHATKKPENIFRDALIGFLKMNDWMVKSTHGNIYQSGFPDLFAAHLKFGSRWIEVKVREYCQFTPAQLQEFPLFSAKGVGIWVLSAPIGAINSKCTDMRGWNSLLEAEYRKLFLPANWHMFLQIMKHHSRLNI